MSRKRNYYRYRDFAVTHFPDEKKTIVDGNANFDFFEHAKLMNLHRESDSSFKEFNGIINSVGVAKCCDEDIYDEHMGMVVASRKCELKAMKSALKDFTRYRKALEKELELVKDIEDKLDLKVLKLSLELIAINRK